MMEHARASDEKGPHADAQRSLLGRRGVRMRSLQRRLLVIGCLLGSGLGCESEDPAGAEVSTTPAITGMQSQGSPTVAGPSAGTSGPGAAAGASSSAGDASVATSAGPAGCKSFEGSYAAIQKVIFEGRGCTTAACHGEAKVGGLDLRAEASWEQLVDAKSSNSALVRVQPGTATDSFLFKKLEAATRPGSVTIGGSPMPVGTAALSESELEAVRIWILRGAPKTGSVADPSTGKDVGSLLDACLPPVKPVKAKPLEAPAAEEGIQFLMPPYVLKAGTEVEQCTPFAYDMTDKVPAKFKDDKRNVIFVNGTQVRQDPQSHHLVLWNPAKDLSSVTANEAGWTCRGGPKADKSCNPTLGSKDCDGGVCAGPTSPGTLCGIDTQALANPKEGLDGLLAGIQAGIGILSQGGLPDQVANTQSPQEYLPPLPGVYAEIPLRGILWFNTHAFNLTDEDTVLDARVNYLYAKELKRQMVPTNVVDANHIGTGQPPFTKKQYCAKAVVPQGNSIPMMTGHTHRHGERFWVNDASGKMIYENFNYSDPVYQHYEPWLEFPQADEKSRTLAYCTIYNNGVAKDGSPDVAMVTRKSRMPPQVTCTPVACVKGKVAAACKVDSDCDSAPGAKDGSCDACPIMGGPTTENEMFVMMPWYVLPAGTKK
jgi:hypothetical protein